MNLEKSEIADVLGVTVEHYRKLEAGVTGISVDKVLTLYHKYGIDPTYLITGESMQIPLHRITDSASNGSVFPVVTEHFSASSDHAFL